MKNPFVGQCVTPEERGQRLKALGLLSRPVLSPSHESQLRELTGGPDWRPLPSQLSLASLKGLFWHHAVKSGIAPDLLIESAASGGAQEASPLASLAIESIRRAALVEQALRALDERGVTKTLLLKGEGLTWLYPAPGLRRMGDVDLAIHPEDSERVADGLRSAGFLRVPIGDGGNWIHPSGLMFDLHVIVDGLMKSVYERSVSHPKFAHIPSVCWPTPSDHLLIIAAHAVRHRGTRIWRDVCDAQALIGMAGGAEFAMQALERAPLFGLGSQVAALFRFMNRRALPSFPLPEEPERGLSEEESRLCRLILSLYDEMAVEAAPVIVFDLLVGFFDRNRFWGRGGRWLRRCFSSSRPSLGPSEATALQVYERSARSSFLGDRPGSSTLALRRLQLGLLWRLIRSGRLGSYRRLFQMQVEIKRASPESLPSVGRDRE